MPSHDRPSSVKGWYSANASFSELGQPSKPAHLVRVRVRVRIGVRVRVSPPTASGSSVKRL